MKVKFKIVSVSETKGLVTLSLKNLLIPEKDINDVKQIDTSNIGGMIQQVTTVMQRQMLAQNPMFHDVKITYLVLTFEQYNEIGKPTVGEQLEMDINEVLRS